MTPEPYPAKRPVLRRILLLLPLLAAVGGLVWGWLAYRQVRAAYDAYRMRIQPGVRVAGIDVGWLTPAEAVAQVTERVARPYYRNFQLHDGDHTLTLSPGDDLGLAIPVEDMVGRAMVASHQYDYWHGFAEWVQGRVETLNVDVPLDISFDQSAAGRYLEKAAQTLDVAPVEPMVDVKSAAFLPGWPGRYVEVDEAATMVNERVLDPAQRDILLPVTAELPDQSPARIESMLSTLVPVMERLPMPGSFYTATVPLSTTGGLANTPLVTYTGELTWTFPQFAGYTGPLTSTTGYFFDAGKPGARFDVKRATDQVQAALQAGVTTPITFEPEPVPPPPLTPDLLIPPLKARLAKFPGVSSLLVKNLDTGLVLYNSNADYVLSGMSVVKIGIMVEVLRHSGGKVDQQTHQELMNMLGSSSCNPCANRLLAIVGNGSSTVGAQRVTQTMQRLGLAHFRLCSPFRLEARQSDPDQAARAANLSPVGLDLACLVPGADPASGAGRGPMPLASGLLMPGLSANWAVVTQTPVTPRYDRCVHATPREMADLVEMIYQCTQSKGTLRKTYPAIFSPDVCRDMVDIMAANDLRNMLGAGIPAEVKMAHKHGFAGYGVSWGDTRAEVGIVFSPGATYLVSFYIWEDSPWIDFGIVQPLYRDVSNMLYNYFNAAEPYWPPPPWAP